MKYNGKYSLKKILLEKDMDEVSMDLEDGRRAIFKDQPLEDFLDNDQELSRDDHVKVFQRGAELRGKQRYSFGPDKSEGLTLKFGTKNPDDGSAKELEITFPWTKLMAGIKQIDDDGEEKLVFNKDTIRAAVKDIMLTHSRKIEDDDGKVKIKLSTNLGIEGDLTEEELNPGEDSVFFFPSTSSGAMTKGYLDAVLNNSIGNDEGKTSFTAMKDAMISALSEFDEGEIAREASKEMNSEIEKLLKSEEASPEIMAKWELCKEKLSNLQNSEMSNSVYGMISDALFLQIFLDDEKSASDVIGAMYNQSPTPGGSYKIPDELVPLADAANKDRGDMTGKGEYVIHFLFSGDTTQGGGNAAHDVTIGGVNWHVKSIKTATATAPMGKQTFGRSDFGSAMKAVAAAAGFADFPGEWSVKRGAAKDAYVEFLTHPDFPTAFASAKGNIPIPVQIQEYDPEADPDLSDEKKAEKKLAIAKNNSIAVDHVITAQMREKNFEGEDGSGSAGVAFYQEDKKIFHLIPADKVEAFGAASQSSHRVGLPSAQGGKEKGYYLLERLMEWAVTGKRTWK